MADIAGELRECAADSQECGYRSRAQVAMLRAADELTALLQLLRDIHNDGDSEFLNKSLRDRIAAAIGDAS
jgi:hypothetical protein